MQFEKYKGFIYWLIKDKHLDTNKIMNEFDSIAPNFTEEIKNEQIKEIKKLSTPLPDVNKGACGKKVEELINNDMNIIESLTNNYTQILSMDVIKDNKLHPSYGNGVGDRFLNKKYNYSVIYKNKKIKLYSENDDDIIPIDNLNVFFKNIDKKQKNGIIGIFIHSLKENKQTRNIKEEIKSYYKKCACVICGSKTDICCDHKNDLYNDKRVLDLQTQRMDDFQALCNHCNLQKRQISKDEKKNKKIYSAKNIKSYQMYDFEFPWEKKEFNEKDIQCKKDTFWYDPIEFNCLIYRYISYILPIVKEIKKNQKVFQE